MRTYQIGKLKGYDFVGEHFFLAMPHLLFDRREIF